ncbi:MAG: GldG family protein [Isosphaeraceae bacterium]
MTDRLFTLLTRTPAWSALLGLALFLGLSWWIRGTPLGQRADRDGRSDPIPEGRRDRAAIAAVLGFLAVLYGGLVALTVGIPWSLPLFAVGFATMIRQGRAHQGERHESPTMGRLVTFVEGDDRRALAGILAIGNSLAFRYGGRPVDLTREGSYTLSSLTRRQLATLEKPLRITVVAADARMARVLKMLDLYRSENPDKVQVERVDPYADPTAFEALAKRAPDLALNPRGGAILLEYGAGDSPDRMAVRVGELFEAPEIDPARPRPGRVEMRFRGEDAITSALIRLREGAKPTIAITAGHGEPAIGEPDPTRQGLGLFASRLNALGMNVVELPPGRQEIGPEVSALVVAGPQAPFPAEEIERINRFVGRGGKVLLFLDNRQKTGLEAWLTAYNVGLAPGTIVDPQLNYERRPMIIGAPVLETDRHPIVESLANLLVYFPGATPLQALPASANPNPAYQAATVLSSGPASWAEMEPGNPALKLDAQDVRGPLPLVVAVSDRPRTPGGEATPRIVVVGSRFLLDNFFAGRDPANLDLAVNALNWLRGRPDLQGIPPKAHVALTLTADPALRSKLVLIPTLIGISVILALGIATFLARRS